MQKLALLLLFCLCYSAVVAQNFIGDKRQKLKKKLENYLQQDATIHGLQETDSSLVLSIHNPKFKPVDFTFLLDSNDECIAEIRSGCDTCLAGYMAQTLEKKSFGWKQHGVSRFLSNARYRVSMELTDNNNGRLLVIRKIPLNRREYQKVLEGLKNRR